MIKNYMVIAKVNEVDYLVRVQATSTLIAEHAVLDLGVCGRHDYGVSGAQAFGAEEMKTDTFIYLALNALTISFSRLEKVIEEHNEEIRKRDALEDELDRVKKELAETERRIEELKARQKDIENALV